MSTLHLSQTPPDGCGHLVESRNLQFVWTRQCDEAQGASGAEQVVSAHQVGCSLEELRGVVRLTGCKPILHGVALRTTSRGSIATRRPPLRARAPADTARGGNLNQER